MLWFALVCIGLHWFALVCIGLHWFALVCFGLLWFALVCFEFALVCFSLLWFALVCFEFALVCFGFALVCFGLHSLHQVCILVGAHFLCNRLYVSSIFPKSTAVEQSLDFHFCGKALELLCQQKRFSIVCGLNLQ